MKPQASAMDAINRIIVFFLVLLPVLSFIMNLMSWMRFGVDLPILDDIRQYASGGAGRMDWAYIMYPANDTLYPVGLIFDALAFRFLDGNTIAYQAISMVLVLGGILFLQWRLLTICTSSAIVRAIAFSCTIFILQPDSYWGWQNMAFHQAVPVLCSLSIISLALSKLDLRASALLIFLISTISGFTYTSGAFANLALLIGLCILSITVSTTYAHTLKYSAIAMALPTVVSVAAQLWVLIWVQHGTHRPDAPMAFPWESDFWFYMLGKIGRSLMLPTEHPEISLSISIFVLILSTLLAVVAIFEARRSSAHLAIWKTSTSYLCIFGVVLLYLFIIAAGRTNLRPENLTKASDIFIFGYARFHFFWACVLWPWMIAFIFELIIKRRSTIATRSELPIIALALLLTLIYNSKIMNHVDFYRTTQQFRLGILSCLSDGVSREAPFECPALHPGVNMMNVYNKYFPLGTSFTKIIMKSPAPIWAKNAAPIFRMTENSEQIVYRNTTIVDKGGKGVLLDTAIDPMIEVTLGDEHSLKNCSVLQIRGSYKLDKLDFAQLFFLPTGVKSFTETYSMGHQLPAGDGDFSFEVHSPTGFEPLIRLDPVISSVPIMLKQVEIRCAVGTVSSK
ncbi:hypothetical protein IFR41_00795 [Pseudomonas fluorescens]|nr:hypothetical protein [Pseudomonas fluorescens]TKK11130.1 hypothetical protein PflCFBP13514_04370 [Pseudomonas fluorescens]